MRFLLVNPFCPITEGPTPPLGISFLAAVLEEAGVEVNILDLSVFPNTQTTILGKLREFRPDIVGITSVTMTFLNAVETLKIIKDFNNDILTVMGGPHVSFCAEESLNSYKQIDLVVRGEGEETIVEIVKCYNSSKNWSDVKGIAFRSPDGIVFTDERNLVDVNSLPLPARHLLPLGRYRALHTPISMTTSRGCPFKCIFCVGRKMVGSKVRYRDPLSVVDELELLSKLDFPQINISDDLFTAKKSHCIAICEEICKRGLKIKWSSFARVDTVNLEVLEAMKKAGCTTISFGVETANLEILKTIKKGITLEKVRKAISLCSQVGILPHVSFILGLPGETKATIQETINFGKEIEKMGALYGFHLLAPFPGTAVCDDNENFDLDILTKDWSQYHANHAIVKTAGVKEEDLNTIAEEWDSETRGKLEEIRKKMKKGEASEEESWQINNLERFLFIYQLMTDEVIEQKGSWINGEKSTTVESAIKGLAKNISKTMNQSESQTIDLLTYVYERGSIYFEEKNGQVSWRWKDYL